MKKEKNYKQIILNQKDLPKILHFNQEEAKRFQGESMVVAPCIDYQDVISQIPSGYLLTIDLLRKIIARKYNVDLTCPFTCGIFVNIVAWASFQDKTCLPYWRVIKSDGQLNEKLPGGSIKQKQLLEKEGFKVIEKGRKNIKYYVSDFEDYLFQL